MKRLLVVTHCSPSGLPQQGFIVAERLRDSGVHVKVIGRAASAWGRLAEIVLYSLCLIPRYEVVLVDVFGLRAFAYESVALLWGRFWRKHVVAFLHNGSMPDFVKLFPRWTRFVLLKPNLVLVPHQYLKAELGALGIRIDRTIQNFIQLENYRYRERVILAPRFLYLRGTHSEYNAPMALRVFALIQKAHPDAHLTMAGKDGEDYSYCRSLVKELRLRNVQFVGIVPKQDITAVADKHDIYINTSRVDNMPVTVIEMWACGLAIVATNVGGIPHLIRDGVDGILVNSEDSKGMANACLRLLADSTLAKSLSRNGRARAEQLSWENVKPIWEAALNLVSSNIA